MSQDAIPAWEAASRFLGPRISAEWSGRGRWDESDPRSGLRDTWRVRLRTPLGSATVLYSQGEGYGGEPPSDPIRLIESLVSDSDVADLSFEDFFSDFHGRADEADPDELRRAEKTWRACRKSRKALERVLGPLFAPSFDGESALPLFEAALALCRERPALAKPDPARGKWGLMALAAYSSHPDSIASAALLGRSVAEESGLDLPSLASSFEPFSSKSPEELAEESDARLALAALSEREALSRAPRARSARSRRSAL